MDPRVLQKMLPYMTTLYGNCHSQHLYGRITSNAVEDARKEVAKLISAKPNEIIFTSGATESNNLAIKGITNYY